MKRATKKEYIILLLLIIMICGGCATPPLSKPTVAAHWALVADVPTNEIVHLSDCYFSKIWPWEEKTEFAEGVFVMTQEVIFLYSGGNSEDILKEREIVLEMRISEIKRAALLSPVFRNTQLHLKYEDHVSVIELRTKYDSDDEEGASFVYDYLIRQGVETFIDERKIVRAHPEEVPPWPLWCLAPCAHGGIRWE
jgi:hypothetical protein